MKINCFKPGFDRKNMENSFFLNIILSYSPILISMVVNVKRALYHCATQLFLMYHVYEMQCHEGWFGTAKFYLDIYGNLLQLTSVQEHIVSPLLQTGLNMN